MRSLRAVVATMTLALPVAGLVALTATLSATNAVAAEDMISMPQPGASEAEAGGPVIVTVDRASVFRVSSPAATVIIGNPSIADATIEDEKTLVLTGRSFGVTNLIILGVDGKEIVDRTLVVRGHESNTVRIYRRSSRETLACAPVCEPTLTIGDNSESFAYANEQIKARNDLSSGNTKQ